MCGVHHPTMKCRIQDGFKNYATYEEAKSKWINREETKKKKR